MVKLGRSWDSIPGRGFLSVAGVSMPWHLNWAGLSIHGAAPQPPGTGMLLGLLQSESLPGACWSGVTAACLGLPWGLWPWSFLPQLGSWPVGSLQQRQGRCRGGLGSGQPPPGTQMESESCSPVGSASPSAVSLPSPAQQNGVILT